MLFLKWKKRKIRRWFLLYFPPDSRFADLVYVIMDHMGRKGDIRGSC